MPRYRVIFLIVIFILLGALLRLNNLAGRSLWTDEFFTYFLATGHGVELTSLAENISKEEAPAIYSAAELKSYLKPDPAKTIGDVTRGAFLSDTHPPLYFWIVYAWIKLFGDSVAAVRFLSLLAGLAAVLLAYRIGGELFHKNAGLASALFTAVSVFAVRYSQEARSYSLILALGLLSWLYILRFEKYSRNIDAFYFSVFSTLGLYTHYFFAFISMAQFCYFTFACSKERAKIDKFYLAFLISILCFCAWYMPLIVRGYNFYNAQWIFGHPGLMRKVYSLLAGPWRYIFIRSGSAGIDRLLMLLTCGLFALIAVSALKEAFLKYRRQLVFCLVMFFLPVLAMFSIDLLQQGALLEQERFWVFPFIGFIPLAGYALSYAFSKNRVVATAVILLMLISSLGSGRLQFGPAPGEVSLWINNKSNGKDALVMVYNIRSVIAAQAYYLDDKISLMPLASRKQLEKGARSVAGVIQEAFLVRHYHPTDNSLLNDSFMEGGDIGKGFVLKDEFSSDYVSAGEYVNAYNQRKTQE